MTHLTRGNGVPTVAQLVSNGLGDHAVQKLISPLFPLVEKVQAFFQTLAPFFLLLERHF
jgi:hypothetical protein